MDCLLFLDGLLLIPRTSIYIYIYILGSCVRAGINGNIRIPRTTSTMYVFLKTKTSWQIRVVICSTSTSSIT